MRKLHFVLLTLAILPFQNCSKGFESAGQNSSQCKIQEKSAAQKLGYSDADLRCGDFASYTCERRVFSPAVETMSHSLTECLPGGRTCVNVDVRQFDTSAIQGTAEDFQPGGSYNNEEVNCAHQHRHHGRAVFTGHADSLEVALSAAMSACENALEKP